MPTHTRTIPFSSSSTRAGISIAVAKANFSSLITGVETKRAPVTILRRGVPVAQLVPFPDQAKPTLRGSMAGTVRELGDIVGPTGVLWELSDHDSELDDDSE